MLWRRIRLAGKGFAGHFDLLRASPDWHPQPPQPLPALANGISGSRSS